MTWLKRLLVLVFLAQWQALSAQEVRRELVEPGAGIIFCDDTAVATDSYVCAPVPALVAHRTTILVVLKPATNNTAAASVAINGLTAKTIVAFDGSVLADNTLVAGRRYILVLDSAGTNFVLQSNGGSGGGLSGLTDNCLLKANGTSAAECSVGFDDGAGNINFGVVTGNHHKWVPVTATGVRSHGLPDASGTLTYNRSITFTIGDKVTGSALTDTHDYPMVWRNNVAAMTIVEVFCQSDAGTPTINLQRDDGGPANILSSPLTCTTSGATASGTIVGAEDNLAVGDKIGFVMGTAGGTAKEVTVQIKATLD